MSSFEKVKKSLPLGAVWPVSLITEYVCNRIRSGLVNKWSNTHERGWGFPMKKLFWMLVLVPFLSPIGFSASNSLNIEIEPSPKEIYCNGNVPVVVKTTNITSSKQKIPSLNFCGQPLRWQWKSESSALKFTKNCQDKTFDLESGETHSEIFNAFVSCTEGVLPAPMTFKLGYWEAGDFFWSNSVSIRVEEDRPVPLQMEVRSVENKKGEQYRAEIVVQNTGEKAIKLEICKEYCFNLPYEDPWGTPEDLKNKISLVEISSSRPARVETFTINPGKQKKISRSFSRLISQPIELQLGYKFYSYQRVWSNKITLPSLIKIEDGINEDEANLLAGEYFLKQFGGCGFPDKPVDRGTYWECQPYVGYAGSPSPKKIKIDKTTGEASLI